MHGQFVWYELATPDVDAATAFYPLLTGWGTQPFDSDYTMWTSDGVPFAGIFTLTDDMKGHGVPPNWMPYVEVDDVDTSASLATSIGGHVVHGPVSIPGVGRFAVVRDPQGATFGLYKSVHPSKSWDGTPALGRFSWHELMAADHDKAFTFYSRLFGWKNTGEMDMGGGNMYLMFGQERMFGGMFTRSGDMNGMPPFWLVYILVPSVEQAVAVATKAGATLHRGPMPIPGGSIAILGDPQGAAFAVHQMDQTPRPAVKLATDIAAKATARKTTAGKTTGGAPKKASAKTAPTKKAPAKKAAAKRVPPKTALAKKAPAKKSPARKAPAKKAPARKAPAKKAPARKAAKKTPANTLKKKTATMPAKKLSKKTARKTTAKKVAAKRRRS